MVGIPDTYIEPAFTETAHFAESAEISKCLDVLVIVYVVRRDEQNTLADESVGQVDRDRKVQLVAFLGADKPHYAQLAVLEHGPLPQVWEILDLFYGRQMPVPLQGCGEKIIVVFMKPVRIGGHANGQILGGRFRRDQHDDSHDCRYEEHVGQLHNCSIRLLKMQVNYRVAKE